MNLKNEIKKWDLNNFENQHILYLNNYKNNKEILNSLIEKAYELNKHEFICENLSEKIKNAKEISKEENKILAIYTHSNLKTGKHNENYEVFKNALIKVRWDSFLKPLILSRIEYSLYELGHYNEALKILEEIKNYTEYDYRNYIECLIKIKNYDKAIRMIKKYAPKSDESKIWKAITLTEISFLKEDMPSLIKNTKNAEKVYLKHRVTDETLTNSGYYYFLGLFNEKIGEKIKAINYFKLSLNNQSELIIDNKYKKLAREKLKEMGAIE